MKITFPHMGTAYIPFRALIAGLGHEAITAPPCTQRTLNLGTRHAPESACLPPENQYRQLSGGGRTGAEAIIMAGGVGPCRFGFYAYVQQEILRDIGCGLEMIILEPPASGWRPLLARLKYLTQGVNAAQISRALQLTWVKLVACDRLEQLSLDIRAYEAVQGSTTRAFAGGPSTGGSGGQCCGVRRAVQEGTAKLQSVPQDRQRPVLTMGVVGEIYTILEPFVNFRLEEQLGKWVLWSGAGSGSATGFSTI